MSHYQVHETFWSIQGEGEHAGKTAVFIRLQGCPVGCEWCDSKLTWYAGGERVSTNVISRIVAGYPDSELLVVTGGEPLLYDLDELFLELSVAFPDRAVHVETSGAYPYKGASRADWTTVSPKYTVDFDVAANVLAVADEFKYVVDEHFSPAVAIGHLRERSASKLSLPPVRLMPEGCPPRPEMIMRTLELLRQYPTWRFGPRLQYDYGPIAEGEGLNNKQVSDDFARMAARSHVRREG